MTKKERKETGTTTKSPMKLLQTIPESSGANSEEDDEGEESGEILIDEQAVVVYHHGRPHPYPLKIQKLLRWTREKPRPRRLPTVRKKSVSVV